MNEPSVIALELNELTPHLMHQWMGQGKLPGFKKLFEESVTYTTDAQESGENLEPWIQWVTVHSGLSYKEHGIYDLGDGYKLRAPRLWDVLSEASKRVWICGSMNTGVRTDKINGAILPDPWSTGLKPYPYKPFKDFFQFVQTNVQEHANSKVPLSIGDYIRFASFMVRNGLTIRTVRKIAAQLFSERSGKFRWRRAMILDRVIWDVFRSQWHKIKPHYATIFLNSCAHLQHYHWRNMSPDDFTIKPPAQDQKEYQNAILEGYQAMDLIVQEALEFVDGTNTSLVMMTALSQQPLTQYDQQGGKQLFKVIDSKILLAVAGITDEAQYSPVMAEDFRLVFATQEQAAQAQEKLLALRCGTAPLMRARRDGNVIYAACEIIQNPGQHTKVSGGQDQLSARFVDLFYPILDIKSGGHNPDGMFWVRTPTVSARVVSNKVPLCATTATLAHLAGLDETTIRKHFLHPSVDTAPLQAQSNTSTAEYL